MKTSVNNQPTLLQIWTNGSVRSPSAQINKFEYLTFFFLPHQRQKESGPCCSCEEHRGFNRSHCECTWFIFVFLLHSGLIKVCWDLAVSQSEITGASLTEARLCRVVRADMLPYGSSAFLFPPGQEVTQSRGKVLRNIHLFIYVCVRVHVKRKPACACSVVRPPCCRPLCRSWSGVAAAGRSALMIL